MSEVEALCRPTIDPDYSVYPTASRCHLPCEGEFCTTMIAAICQFFLQGRQIHLINKIIL